MAGGELMDAEFPGVHLIIDLLSKLEDKELIWKYSECLFRRDPTKAVRVYYNLITYLIILGFYFSQG